MKNGFRCSLAAVALAAGLCGAASAGPVILGGDDLTDHGSRTAAGVNVEGWLYIEKAVDNVLSSQTRPGPLNFAIAALGAASTPGYSTANAGSAIGSAAQVLGRSVLYVDGATAINRFFADLNSGAVNVGMLWFAGTGTGNDIDSAEGAALTANANAINAYGVSGGGIMAHGFGGDAYGWLSTLLPGLNEVSDCTATGATLTVAGQAAFPGLSNNDINQNAGPCHSSFTGNFGGLTTLALDGNGRSFIIGGGAGTVIACGIPGRPDCPPPPTGLPEPGSLPLLAVAAVAWVAVQRRWRKR